MTLITIREELIGKTTLRLLRTAAGFAAVALDGAKRSDPIFGDDPDELWAQARREIGKVSPNYFGFDGARARFAKMFPGGFADPRFDRFERNYKVAASQMLNETLPLVRAHMAGAAECELAIKVFGKTDLLSPFEQARVREVLKSLDGPPFLRGAAAFTDGQIGRGLAEMDIALQRHGPATWPLATYLPFLWRPHAHLFLKPQVTRDFAERVAHHFAYDYASGLNEPVYASLLDMAAVAEAELASLKPQDRIDLQSFIWVVGDYQDKDVETQLKTLAASAAGAAKA